MGPGGGPWGQEAALGLRSFLQDFCDPAHPVMVRIEYTDSMKRKFATFKGGVSHPTSDPSHEKFRKFPHFFLIKHVSLLSFF